MKIDKTLARRVLWAPTAILSVSITIYLSHLALSKDDIKPLNSLLSEPPEVVKEEVIPKSKEGNGEEEKQEQSQNEQKERQEEQKEEEAQQQEEKPPSVPPPPSPPQTTVSNQNDGEGESSSDKEESQNLAPSLGNADLKKYIEAKIKDLSAHGKDWNDRYQDELLAS